MNAKSGVRNAELNGFSRFEQDGFQITNSLVSINKCDRLAAELTPLFEQQIGSAKNRIGGIRNLLRTNLLISAFSKSPAILEPLQIVTGREVFPVRAIFFDKYNKTNWLAPWHKDLSIAVVRQIETPGFAGWSVKDGTVHVHPPEEILAGMIALRLHLDDCGAGNGALKVVAGSHLSGKIPAAEFARWTLISEPITCEIAKGGVLLMRPLLLHASSPASNPDHRRVLHIGYATQRLPNGLEWFDN